MTASRLIAVLVLATAASAAEDIAAPALRVISPRLRVTKVGGSTETALKPKIQVDTAKSVAAAKALARPGADIDALMQSIEKDAGVYQPFVFYVLAQALLDRGRKDDAAVWYYRGRVRARYDAERCADFSARQATRVLEIGYPRLSANAGATYERLLGSMKKAAVWDKATPYAYDPRWINLHGMQAITGGDKPASIDKTQWPKIHARVHDMLARATSQLEARGKERYARERAASLAQAKKQLDDMIRQLEAKSKNGTNSMLEDLRRRRKALEDG